MKTFAIELNEEMVNLIKEHYRFKSDAEVRKQLQYWVDLSIAEVVIKGAVKVLEAKDVET